MRSNVQGRLGFVKDRQRVCVAISRAMRQLVIVGCADTMAADGCWRMVNSRAEPQSHRRWESLGRAAAKALPSDEAGRSVLEELAKGKADAKEAMLAQNAVLLMRQQPSFSASRRRENLRGVPRAVMRQSSQPSRELRRHQNKQLSTGTSSGLSTGSAQLDSEQYETAFPTLGASRAPVRALHLAGNSQPQPVREAVAPHDQLHTSTGAPISMSVEML